MRVWAISLLLVCGMALLDSQVANAKAVPYPCAHNFNQAMALRRSGDPAASIRHFEEAIRICPDPLFYRQLGHAYRDLKRWKEAEQAYTNAIKMDPSDGELRLYRGILRYSVEAYDHSFQDLKAALARSLDKEAEHQALYYLGLVHLGKHQFSQAVAAMQEAIDACGNCTDRDGYKAQLRDTRKELKKEQEQKPSPMQDPRQRQTMPQPELARQQPPQQPQEQREAEQRTQELQRQQEETARLLQKQKEDQAQAQQRLDDLKRQSEEMARALEKQRQEQLATERQTRELKLQQEDIERKVERQKREQQMQEQQTRMPAQSNSRESLQGKRSHDLAEVLPLPEKAMVTTPYDPGVQPEHDQVVEPVTRKDSTLKNILREHLYNVRRFFLKYRSHLAYMLLLGFVVILILLIRLIYTVAFPRLHRR